MPGMPAGYAGMARPLYLRVKSGVTNCHEKSAENLYKFDVYTNLMDYHRYYIFRDQEWRNGLIGCVVEMSKTYVTRSVNSEITVVCRSEILTLNQVELHTPALTHMSH